MTRTLLGFVPIVQNILTQAGRPSHARPRTCRLHHRREVDIRTETRWSGHELPVELLIDTDDERCILTVTERLTNRKIDVHRPIVVEELDQNLVRPCHETWDVGWQRLAIVHFDDLLLFHIVQENEVSPEYIEVKPEVAHWSGVAGKKGEIQKARDEAVRTLTAFPRQLSVHWISPVDR